MLSHHLPTRWISNPANICPDKLSTAMFQYMFYVFSFFHHTFVDHAREAGKRLAREKVLHPESARPGASVTAIMQQLTVITIQHSQ